MLHCAYCIFFLFVRYQCCCHDTQMQRDIDPMQAAYECMHVIHHDMQHATYRLISQQAEVLQHLPDGRC